MLRTFIITLLTFFSFTLPAQDIVVFSKYSENALKELQEIANSSSEKELLELYKLESVKTLTVTLEKYAEATFTVDKTLPEKCKEIVTKALNDFKTKVKALSKTEQIKQIPTLKSEFDQALIKELNALEKTSLKPIIDATSELEKEKKHNQSLFDAINIAELQSIDSIVGKILKTWKKNNSEVILETSKDFIADIKPAAMKKAQEDAETNFPFPATKTLEEEAIKKFRLYKVGDKVKIKYSPRPSQVLTASGQIRAIDGQKVKINFNSVNIKDIVDPATRDGMSKKKTLENRKKYIENRVLGIKKKRLNYIDDTVQLIADNFIKENEKKGYVLYIGNWTPIAKVASDYITSKAKSWKQVNADALEKAALNNAKLIDDINSNTSTFRNFFSKSLATGQKDLTTNADQLISEAELADDDVELTEEALLKLEEEQAEEKKKQQEAAAKAAADKKKAALAAQRKKQALEQQRLEQEAASQNNMIMIGAALVIIAGVAFVAFNSKVRNKLFGKKKKSMHEMVNNLQAPAAQDGSTPPLPVPGPGGPTGSMAPKPKQDDAAATGSMEKSKIELDDGLSIERGGDDAPAAPAPAAPRKKISLNLGGSTASLDNKTIDESEGQVSGGGLTPPGGGLTPPGGGLTPPGGGLTPPGGGLTPPGGGQTPPGGGLKPPGGLTPPGGGLTPPGGGLKPPGTSESNDDSSSSENSDKSNLILNPNLDGSGDKLRLKK